MDENIDLLSINKETWSAVLLTTFLLQSKMADSNVTGEVFSGDDFKELLASLGQLMGRISSSFDNGDLFLLDRCRKEWDYIVRMMLAIPRSVKNYMPQII